MGDAQTQGDGLLSRLAHIWSGFCTPGYLVRPAQVVRSRYRPNHEAHGGRAPPRQGTAGRAASCP